MQQSETNKEAAGEGARLIVLPELAISGYVFRDREEAFALAEEVPAGETTATWIDAADGMMSTSLLVLPSAQVVRFTTPRSSSDHRVMSVHSAKCICGPPRTCFLSRAISAFRSLRLLSARIGVAICYDGWFPETFRLQALQGADIVCVPTNWVPIPGQEAGRPAMANILHQAAAHSNSLFIACADRVGTERGQLF